MRKKGFTIIEVVVVFLLVLAVTFLILPKSLNSTKQAKLISRWNQSYSDFEYIFSVIKAQKETEIKDKIKSAEDSDAKQEAVIETIKPFLRINKEASEKYNPTFMNGIKIDESSKYYISKYYNTENNETIGLKWFKDDCENKEACAFIAVDVNSELPPNQWGRDIFGINILKNEIEPIGKGLAPHVLRNDCRTKSSGIYCSYYYLIGGRFD